MGILNAIALWTGYIFWGGLILIVVFAIFIDLIDRWSWSRVRFDGKGNIVKKEKGDTRPSVRDSIGF